MRREQVICFFQQKPKAKTKIPPLNKATLNRAQSALSSGINTISKNIIKTASASLKVAMTAKRIRLFRYYRI